MLADVGRGGMSVVYRAVDPVLDRTVALKLLAPALVGDELALSRFRREATAVAGLKHQSIALVYDFGEHERQPFIAFEWIDGPTLRDWLQSNGRMSFSAALRLFNQIADALAYAHERGVIHRDIKPANIIITHAASDQAHATLVDFGLAWMADVPSITTTGTFYGTPLYMAPEQIQGGAIDQRTDLYSLAFVLYEMVTGAPPFDNRSTPAVLNRQLTETPAPPSELAPSLPAALDAVIARATAKRASDRYATVREFQAAVNALAPVTIATAATAKPTRAPRWLIGGGLMAALTAVGFIAFRGASSPTPLPTATPPPTTAAIAPTEAPTIEPAAPSEPTPAPAQPTALPTLSPDASWLTSGYNASRSRYVNLLRTQNTEAPRWTQSVDGDLGEPLGVVVAQDRAVALYANGELRAFDADSGEPAWQVRAEPRFAAPPAICCFWGRAVVVAPLEDGQIVAYELATGKEAWRLAADAVPGGVAGGFTHGDDGMLYASTYGNHLISINGFDGALAWSLALDNEEPRSPPAMTNAGIYVLSDKNALIAIDRAKRVTVWRIELPARAVLPPAVSGDGSAVLVALDNKSVLAVSALSGQTLWTAPVNENLSGLALDWGRVYATGYDGSVYAWNVNDGRTRWQVRLTAGIETPPLTDAQRVLVVDSEGNLHAFEVEGGLEQPEFRYAVAGAAAPGAAWVDGWLFVQAEGGVRAYGPGQ